MKLIKKIAAIMFAFMMVVSMSTNVSAEGTNNGTITINNAVDGQTYTIYKLLDLESYTPDPGTDDGIYSYKPNKLWKNFLESAKDSAGTKYFDINENGYATWNGNQDDSRRAKFAQEALVYAKNEQNGIKGSSLKKEEGTTLSFSGLSLGYYLVESSVGALCSLDTTKPSVTIKEKNGVPTVEKTITDGGVRATDNKSNSVNIGDTVTFQTIINVKKGAQGYVLHDTLSNGLKLISKVNNLTDSPIMAVAYGTDESGKEFHNNLIKNSEYTITYDDNNFTVTILDSYLKNHETVDYDIAISYKATLTDAAVIGEAGNTNTTYLKYGVNSESTPSTTTTYTFEIPVYKYTGTDENKQDLAGAKFKLYTNNDFTEANEVKVIEVGTNYFVGSTDAKKNVMTSPQSGEFTIKGLKAGTYYLKEIKAPKGYNLLANAVEVHITEAGKVEVRNGETLKEVNRVDVQNKSGTLLPHTGGAGTTMIYLVGALLVLGSGVVLASKRRSNSK